MIYSAIQQLIDYSIQNGLMTKDDELVIRNQLMNALHVYDWQDEKAPATEASVDELLAPLVDYACQNGVIEDTTNNRDLFDTLLMGIVTPLPREIIRDFHAAYEKSPEAATEWYFDISQKTNYVRAGRIAKDMKWKSDSEFGVLDITINRSKPEKDPRDIAKARASVSTAYPKCQLCAENMGFAGNQNHPARQNLRPIPITIHGEPWYLQYSPYGYYNEHCIVFNHNHIPMVIDAAVFDKLFDFAAQFPHYFVGSNADLPIVGGSILSHEHFQGGHYTFAMAKAEIETPLTFKGFEDVRAGIVKWPMSVIRLRCADKLRVAELAEKILKAWRGYSDPSVTVFAETDGEPHNTITPIARRRDGDFEMDLVLRNNLTTEEYPLGLFHPHQELHHIKKENIGLIEVMGLAVLPARLKGELKELEKLIVEGGDIGASESCAKHAPWVEELKTRYTFTADNTEAILRQEVGVVFMKVLEHAGVFKRDAEGHAAFLRFAESVN